MADWKQRWVGLMHEVASWSKDRNTKVGAVIVSNSNRLLSNGYNGFPRGCDDERFQRHERPWKYFYTEHAERNAIYNAAYEGISLKDSTLYVSMFPCADCARAIIQSGVKKVITYPPDEKRKDWKQQFDIAVELFKETNIEVEFI